MTKTVPSGRRYGAAAFCRNLRKNRIYLLLLLPAVVYVLIFSYAPMVGVVMAFEKYNFTQGLFASPWVGLKDLDAFIVEQK